MKTRKIFTMALIALMGTGCQIEEVENVSTNKECVLLAIAEEANSTRAAFWGPDESIDQRGKFFWTKGDQLLMTNSYGNLEYKLEMDPNAAGSGTAAFSFKDAGKRYLGSLVFYPADANIKNDHWDVNKLIYTYPTNYTLTREDVNLRYEVKNVKDYKSFGIPMVGKVVDGKVKMKHVGAALFFPLTATDTQYEYDLEISTSISPLGLDIEEECQGISGQYAFTYDEESTGDAWLSSTSNELVTFKRDKPFLPKTTPTVIHLMNLRSDDCLVCVPLPAGNYEKGLKITLYKVDGGKRTQVFRRILPPFELHRGDLVNVNTPLYTNCGFTLFDGNNHQVGTDYKTITKLIKNTDTKVLISLEADTRAYKCVYKINGVKQPDITSINWKDSVTESYIIGANTTGERKYHSFQFFEKDTNKYLGEYMFIQLPA